MTLDVHVFRRNADGSLGAVPLDESRGNPHLAGFESWRLDVWGSAIVRSWGCRILPTLATGDVYASGALLEQMAQDVALIERRLGDLAAATGVDRDVLAYRLGNIGRAVAIAMREQPGTAEVRIW